MSTVGKFISRSVRASVACLVLAVSAPLAAAPSVQGASGSFNHKESVTINGSGFGSKSTAAPFMWDDASGSSLSGSGWNMAVPNSASSSYNIQYRNSGYRGVSAPHGNNSRYIVGGHTDTWAPYSGGNVMFGKGKSVPNGTVFYGRAYFRLDPNWQFGGSASLDNHKMFAWNIGGDGPYQTPDDFYIDYDQGAFNNCGGGVTHKLGIDILQNPDNNGHSNWWGSGDNPCSGWVLYEFEVKKETNSSGYIKAWANGQQVVNYSGLTSNGASNYISPAFGGYSSTYERSPTNNFRYFTDVYMDWTAQRVIIGDRNTLAASTIREIQIPTAWNNSSVTVDVNLGQFAQGETAYVYVVDASGNANSSGMPITVGSSVVGTAPPSPPSNIQ